jgi:hypothetical protein
MKTKLHVLLIFLICLVFTRCESEKSGESTQSQQQDEESIQQVIASETQAFVDRDSVALMNYYSDDDITQSAWNNPNGSYSSLKGIDNIRNNFRNAFRNNPARQHLPDIDRTGWHYRRLSDEWMWVNFIQEIKLTNGKLYTSYETRLMKKENSSWKIAVMYALSDHAADDK